MRDWITALAFVGIVGSVMWIAQDNTFSAFGYIALAANAKLFISNVIDTVQEER